MTVACSAQESPSPVHSGFAESAQVGQIEGEEATLGLHSEVEKALLMWGWQRWARLVAGATLGSMRCLETADNLEFEDTAVLVEANLEPT